MWWDTSCQRCSTNFAEVLTETCLLPFEGSRENLRVQVMYFIVVYLGYGGHGIHKGDFETVMINVLVLTMFAQFYSTSYRITVRQRIHTFWKIV